MIRLVSEEQRAYEAIMVYMTPCPSIGFSGFGKDKIDIAVKKAKAAHYTINDIYLERAKQKILSE